VITTANIIAKIELFAKELDQKNSGVAVSKESCFTDFLMDDFDLIELIMILEETFEVVIDDKLFNPHSTIYGLVDHILAQTTD